MDWQPIVTAPQEEPVLFWVVPKTADEAFVNSRGDPIVGVFAPYIFFGRFECWSSLSKATHWMPLPSPPTEAQ